MSGWIAILGAGGFIGGRLRERFGECPDREVSGFTSPECDLLSRDSIARALAGVTPCDTVIIAAAVNRLRENSFRSLVRNLEMVENLARFLARHPPAQVIYLSSADVYGLSPEGGRIREDLVPDPADHYAVGKLAGEALLRNALGGTGAVLTVFRLSGVYGPGDGGRSTIGRMVESARAWGRIAVAGDGSARRDYLHVDDLYRITSEAIERRIGATVNLASGDSHSIAGIAEIIRAELGRPVALEFEPPDAGAPRRIQDLCFDLTRLWRHFPAIRLTPLREGLAEYFRSAEAPLLQVPA